MISKFKSFLYTQVYINILPATKKTIIYIEEVQSNGSSKSYEEVFDSTKKNEINECIKIHARKSPIHYISILDNSISQGATPTCSSKDMAAFCDLGESNHICYGEQWGYYTSKLDILALQNKYKKVGLDFIFSPFLLIADFFKDKISTETALFVLVEKDSISLSIFDNSRLLFAEHLDIGNDTEFEDELSMNDDVSLDEDLELDVNDDDNGIDLEEINVMDDLDSLEEFDDIEDLETFDDMDDFAEDEPQEIGESAAAVAPELSMDNESSFGEDYHRFSLIQSSINNFYKDDRFDSDFILKVYIADGVGVTQELKKFLQEEMYLDVVIRKIDLGARICELAKVEKK